MTRFHTLLLLFMPAFSYGQQLSIAEAHLYVERLERVDILSSKGREYFDTLLEASDWPDHYPAGLQGKPYALGPPPSRSHLLLSLRDAFHSALLYRIGIYDGMDARREFEERNSGTSPGNLYKHTLDSVFNEGARNSIGRLIEEKIGVEDSLVPSRSGLSFNLNQAINHGAPKLGLVSPHRSALGKTRRRTARDLRDIGLVSDTVCQEILALIDEGVIAWEREIFVHAAERMAYFENYALNRARETEWLVGLAAVDVLPEGELRVLTQRPDLSPLLEGRDLLAYTKRTRLFDLNKLPVAPAEGYARIFAEISTLIPDFTYTDFKAVVMPARKKYGDLTAYKLSLAFTADGQEYRHSAFYDFRREGDPQDTVLQLAADFHPVINKYLSDRESPYRLHLARTRYPHDKSDPSAFGVILLTEEQYDRWNVNDRAQLLSREDFGTLFTTASVRSVLEEYERLGLFNHLSATEIAAGWQCVSESTIECYTDLLECFPDVIVYFDWETGNLEDPYAELTRAFARASRGAFQPVDIQDDFADSREQDSTNYGFRIGDETYETTLRMERDWLDSGFLTLIKRALEKSGAGGTFHFCLDDGQASGFIYLTPAQYDYLSVEQPDLFPSY